MPPKRSDDADLRPVTPLGIIAQRLDQLCDRAARGGLDPEGLAELHGVRDLATGLDPYLDRNATPESAALAALDKRTREQRWTGFGTSEAAPTLEAEMLSGHVEGRFLDFVVRMSGATRVLEVGMFTGYSALAMAEALPEDGVVVACEIDPEVAEFARRCFDGSASGAKIDVRVGPAADTLRRLATNERPFDLVFVDADKAGYATYLDLILDGGLLAAGGTICVDNTLMQGQAYLDGERTVNGDAIAEFNERVAHDDRLDQVLVPLRDGVTLIRRRGE